MEQIEVKCNWNLLERQRYLFNNVGWKFPSDVQFYFKGEDIKLNATKMILSSASSVFEAMFYGSMAIEESVTVDINGISSDIFREVLRFIYLDEVCLFNHNIGEILSASHFYQISSLEKKCIEYMNSNLKVSNAALFYRNASILEIVDINFYQKLLEFIDENMEEICTIESILDLDSDQFISLTKRSSLYVSEFTLLCVSAEWSRRNCERQRLAPTPSNRKLVFEEFKSIRFNLMTKMEFDRCATVLLTLNILTPEGILSFYKNEATNTADTKRCERVLAFEISETAVKLLNANHQILQFTVTKYTTLRELEFFNNCKIKLTQREKEGGGFGVVLYERNEFSQSHKFLPYIVLQPNKQFTLEVHVFTPRSQYICSVVVTQETSFVLQNRIAIIKKISFL